jgi:hypothetical protein
MTACGPRILLWQVLPASNKHCHKKINSRPDSLVDRLCGLVVEFLATDPEVPGSILGAIGFSEK